MESVLLAKKIRLHTLKMLHNAGASHIACIFSIADILAILYADIMKFDVNNPLMASRDRFILSKGHAGAGVYAVLAEMGFFPLEELNEYCEGGGRLSGHISHKNVPGVEFSTGSLGHGVCVASGMALAAKRDGLVHRVFTLIGDGECNEGSVWEMALFANHYRLNNFVVVVDHNKMQSLGFCEETLELIDLKEKWKSFGWNVYAVNGHNHFELKEVFLKESKDKPTCIIAHTIKGKGVSFMENNILWHYRDPQGKFYSDAIEELRAEKK